MYCDACPHKRKIEAALESCQSCTHACHHQTDPKSGRAIETHEGNAAACKSCPHLREVQRAIRPCAVCEAGKLHGQVHIDAAPDPSTVLRYRVPDNHAPTPGVTNLEPEVEDAVRKAFFVLFDLTPIELMLLQHIVHGRSVGTFRETLAMLRDRLNGHYDLSPNSTSFRAVASIWKNKIVEKLPAARQMIEAVVAEAQTSKHNRHASETELGDDVLSA